MSKISNKDKRMVKRVNHTHRVWHKFSNWLTKTYGKDLHGKWKSDTYKNADGKKITMRYRSFNDLELSRRLVGYEVMEKVRKFIKRACPEIVELSCDDHHFAGSMILLIPHPKQGITVMFIPQCTTIQNQFFLYAGHCDRLIKALTKMKKVYPKYKE